MTSLPAIGEHALNEAEAEQAFGAILDGHADDAAIAQFLIALSDRGETAAEIAGAARAMRARMIAITAPAPHAQCLDRGQPGRRGLRRAGGQARQPRRQFQSGRGRHAGGVGA
jgi:anthranilate phosphoribosyltransferase